MSVGDLRLLGNDPHQHVAIDGLAQKPDILQTGAVANVFFAAGGNKQGE